MVESDPRSARRGKRKVLVVDDSQIVLEILRDRLEAAGFEVTLRNEPLGTGQWISENQPEFVLLDVEMPALSGGGLAALLKKRATTRQTMIIFHSSLPQERLQELVKSSGATGAIQKTDDEVRVMKDLMAIVGPRR
jgi:two-component system OmpR family response regulator